MGRRANQASARRDRVQAYLEMSAPEDVISWTMRMRLRDSHDSQTSVSTLERYARAPVSMIRTRAAGSDVTTVACKADLKSASARKATGTSSDEAGTSSDKGCGHWNLRCKGLPRPAPTSHGSASSTQAPSSCRAGVNRAAHRAAPMAACRPAADRRDLIGQEVHHSLQWLRALNLHAGEVPPAPGAPKGAKPCSEPAPPSFRRLGSCAHHLYVREDANLQSTITLR